MERTCGSDALGLVGLVIFLSQRAVSGSFPMAGFVQLQASTPGVQETGHANVSGTMKSGKVQTGSFQMGTSAPAGSVLTANAAGVGTWQVPSFPLPFAGTALSASGGSYGGWV